METAALISIDEYLRTSYDPDCDYVDGRLEERNVGKRDHSAFQAEVTFYLITRKKQWGIRAYTEQRIRISPRRVRLPDVCVVKGSRPEEEVFTQPPFICIEILSEEDRVSRVQERLNDYLEFGVPYIWLVDPVKKQAWTYSSVGLLLVQDGVLRASQPSVTIPLADIFAEME